MRCSSASANKLTHVLVGYLGLAALLLACWQMAERYLLPQLGSVWVEEVVIYLIAWATFLGAAALVHDDKHVRADVLIRLMPLPVQRYVEMFNCLLGLMFCGAIAWLGWLITVDALRMDERSATGSAFPIWIFQASLPVGVFLSAIWYARRIFKLAFRFEAGEFEVKSGHDA